MSKDQPEGQKRGQVDIGGYPDPGQVSAEGMTGKPRVRFIPVVLVLLSTLCSIRLTGVEGMYLPGHALALVVALAVPVAYCWLSRDAGAENSRLRAALTVGLSVVALVLAAGEAIMLSYGSAEGAVADIGGAFLWLVGTVGLLGLTGLAASLWPRREH